MDRDTMQENEKGWSFILPLKQLYQLPDTNRVVSSVKISITETTLDGVPKKWVRVDFGSEGNFPQEAAGYGFNGQDFTDLGSDTLAEDEIINQIRDKYKSDTNFQKELQNRLT